MHLVFLNQYYPPDAAPTGVMLEGVVRELVRDGHDVTVLCASGGYADSRHKTSRRKTQEGEEENVASVYDRRSQSEEKEGVRDRRSQLTIHRIGASRFGRGTFIGKLLDYASYYLGVAWKLMVMQPKPDRIIALTTPPLLSVLARLLSKFRGADHAHWVMDLYPDVMAAHGMLGENNPGYRILAKLARWGFGGPRRAALLTLGPDMAERVERLLGTSNIGRRTSNFEGTGNEEAGRGVSNSQPSTLNPQLSPVQWVPLWAADCSGVSVTVAGCSSGREGVSEAVESESPARFPQLCPREGKSAAVADAPLQEDGQSSNQQPSTINSQPSTSSLRRKRGWADGELIVMYSGNMGLGHRFGEILAAASRSVDVSPTSHPDSQGSTHPINSQSSSIRFVFFGGGKRRVEVETFVRANPGCGVEVHDYAPAEELSAHLQSADVHLASLDTAWTGTMVPSKLQGIFAAGRAVIFIGSAESSIGRWVLESGGGWVVRAGDVDGLLAALDEARDPEVRLTRGRAAKRFAEAHFDGQTNIARVAAILATRR